MTRYQAVGTALFLWLIGIVVLTNSDAAWYEKVLLLALMLFAFRIMTWKDKE